MVQTRSTYRRNLDVDGHPPGASDSYVVSRDCENAEGQPSSAIARRDYKAVNRLELSFSAGDEISELEKIGPNLWRGYNTATQKEGNFHKDHVRFQYTEEEKRHIRKPDAPLSTPVRPQSAIPRQFATKPEYGSLQSIPKNSLIFVAAVIVVAVGWWYTDGQFLSSRKVRVNINDLKTYFASQEPDMWDSLKAGLMSSRTEGVKTFLFLHNSPRTAVCFIKKLSGNNCVAYRATDVSNSDAFVSEVKAKLLTHKCLIMYDLEDLHPDGVAVLKGFCDAYEPVVPGSLFYFALNAGAHLDTEAKKLARNLLEAKWSKDFTYDDFGGTLTRLTQNVLKIHNEPNVSC